MKLILLVLALAAALPFSAIAGDTEEGEGLFEARCALCHQLPDPGQFNPDQWKKVLDLMQMRAEQKRMPPISDADKTSILNFLAKSARK